MIYCPVCASLIEGLRAYMAAQRKLVPEGSAIAKAIDYSLNRWGALTRFLEDGDIPMDNNWHEHRIRPIAVGRRYLRLTFMQGFYTPA